LVFLHSYYYREMQAGEDMRQLLQEKAEQMEEELEQLARRNREKEENEMRMVEEINMLR
jgi:hypothetical protein